MNAIDRIIEGFVQAIAEQEKIAYEFIMDLCKQIGFDELALEKMQGDFKEYLEVKEKLGIEKNCIPGLKEIQQRLPETNEYIVLLVMTVEAMPGLSKEEYLRQIYQKAWRYAHNK